MTTNNAERSAAAWGNFLKRIAERGYTVLEPSWLGSGKPHRCQCTRGHECWLRPNDVQQGDGRCPECTTSSRIQTLWENFRKSVAEQGGKVLEPSWLGYRAPHRAQCVQGHACSPRPAYIQQSGSICPRCAHVGRAQAAWKAFQQRVTEQHGTVLEQTWLGGRQPHLCRCSRGHECKPRPDNTLTGQGICQLCAWWEHDVIYVVRNPATGCVKFGITSRNARIRLEEHYKDGFTEQVIPPVAGLPCGLAARVEQKIKLALAMAGAKPILGPRTRISQSREYFGDEHIALILNEISNWIPDQERSR